MRLPGNIDVYKRYCETCSLDKFCHECKNLILIIIIAIFAKLIIFFVYQ